MTVEEIFIKIASHMIKGMMVHEQLANYYQFLALEGYKCCHDYHFLDETLSYRELQRFYIDKYNKLIPDAKIENPKMIPDSWYKHVRQDVDAASKRTYIKDALEHWHAWEKETHKLYHDMVRELEAIEGYAAADWVRCLMCDVEKEILGIEKKQLKLLSVDYSMNFIVQRQRDKKEYYLEKMKNLL